MKHWIFSVRSVILVLLFSSCTSTRYAEKHFQRAKKAGPYDVIIIPGVPYEDSTSSNFIFAARILWSKYLMDSSITKNVIYSGSAVGSAYYEGLAMKIIADSLGLMPTRTFAETKAEHSTENAYYGMKMAYKMGFKKIALATDPFQTKTLRSMLKKRCDNMAIIPIVFNRLDPDKKRDLKLPSIDPKEAFDSTFVPLASRESFFERLRGTFGKHINFDEK